MLTTITVNGSEGLRFLSSLSDQVDRDDRVPAALVTMVDRGLVSIEVEARLAEEIAAFVDGIVGSDHLPLLFSAQINDHVAIARNALVEMHAASRRHPRTWRFIAGGTRGRLVGRYGELGKVLLLEGREAHEHAYVSDSCMTRMRSRRR